MVYGASFNYKTVPLNAITRFDCVDKWYNHKFTTQPSVRMCEQWMRRMANAWNPRTMWQRLRFEFTLPIRWLNLLILFGGIDLCNGKFLVYCAREMVCRLLSFIPYSVYSPFGMCGWAYFSSQNLLRQITWQNIDCTICANATHYSLQIALFRSNCATKVRNDVTIR